MSWRILTLAVASLLPFSVLAADTSKEGTFTGTYHGVGMSKAIPAGKSRFVASWEENGYHLTDGFLNHATDHCWGLGDFTNGVGGFYGYCVTTDRDGDQVVMELHQEKHPFAQKDVRATLTYTSGTGKYAGISGQETNVLHNEFRQGSDGTFVSYVTVKGSYKLP